MSPRLMAGIAATRSTVKQSLGVRQASQDFSAQLQVRHDDNEEDAPNVIMKPESTPLRLDPSRLFVN